MFKPKKMRNGGNATCPFILALKIGLWQSPTGPQFKQTSMNPHIHCLMKFAKNKQTKH